MVQSTLFDGGWRGSRILPGADRFSAIHQRRPASASRRGKQTERDIKPAMYSSYSCSTYRDSWSCGVRGVMSPSVIEWPRPGRSRVIAYGGCWDSIVCWSFSWAWWWWSERKPLAGSAWFTTTEEECIGRGGGSVSVRRGGADCRLGAKFNIRTCDDATAIGCGGLTSPMLGWFSNCCWCIESVGFWAIIICGSRLTVNGIDAGLVPTAPAMAESGVCRDVMGTVIRARGACSGLAATSWRLCCNWRFCCCCPCWKRWSSADDICDAVTALACCCCCASWSGGIGDGRLVPWSWPAGSDWLDTPAVAAAAAWPSWACAIDCLSCFCCNRTINIIGTLLSPMNSLSLKISKLANQKLPLANSKMHPLLFKIITLYTTFTLYNTFVGT